MTNKFLIAINMVSSLTLFTTSFAADTKVALTDAVRSLEQGQSAVQSVGEIKVASADCAPTAPKMPLDQIEYTQCKTVTTKSSTADDYLNSKLAGPYAEALKLIGPEVTSDDFSQIARCVNFGLNSSPVGTFYNCPTEKDSTKKLKKMPRPCPTKELVGTISAEIMRAAHCLGRDYKKVLPIFMHESRFRPNVYSYSGAGGVSQVTGIAIKDINRFTKEIKEIANDTPECAYLADLKDMNSSYSCARTVIPPNPRQNIIYGIFYQTYIEDGDPRYSPRSLVNSLQAKRTKKLTKNELDHLTEVLLHVSYNGGKGAALPSLQTLRDDPNTRNLALKDFLKKYFALVKKKVGEQPATYHNDIVRDSKLMEENSGADCTIY